MRRFALPAILLTACGADPVDTAPEQPTACVPEIERVETWCATDYGDAVCSTRLHWTCGDRPGIATVSWYLDAPRPGSASVNLGGLVATVPVP